MNLPHSPVNWRHSHWNRFGVALLLLWLVALAVRLPELSNRPMHTDEAVQADKAGVLWTKSEYRYDPEEYHGPSLYYLTLPVLWLSSAQNYAQTQEFHYRLVPVLFGAGLVLLLLLTVDGLGPWASVWAGVLLSLSPMMVFYSRYYIQEMLLVFLTYLFMAACWRYTRGAPRIWIIIGGAALGLMHATKETWVLSVVAMGAAFVLTVLWSHWIDKTPLQWRAHWKPHLKARGVGIGLLLAIIFMSSLGTNPRGPWDSVRAYAIYLNRGGGEGEGGSSGGSDSDHVHPPGYYVGRLLWTKYDYKRNEILFGDMLKDTALLKKPSAGPAWSEALIFFLAFCGFIAALMKRGIGRAHLSFVRFLAFYTIILAVIYEIIPYKTPWCALGFWHTAILLAGFGAVALVRTVKFMPAKVIVVLFLAVAAFRLGQQCQRANFGRFVADERNPWVYSHTGVDIYNLRDRVENIAQVVPNSEEMVIKIVTPDQWPLPWYLRRFKYVGYYTQTPPDLPRHNPAIVIAAEELNAEVSKHLPNYKQEIFGQRRNVFLVCKVHPQLWETFIETRR